MRGVGRLRERNGMKRRRDEYVPTLTASHLPIPHPLLPLTRYSPPPVANIHQSLTTFPPDGYRSLGDSSD